MRILAVAIICLSSFSLLFAQETPKTSSKQLRTPVPLAAGSITDHAYRNPELGISYKILLGWVDRTDRSKGESDSSNGQVLLAVFEHPPEVKGEGINSAVIIAAENLSAYPEVKTAADYFDLLSEATTSQGFKVVNEPYATNVGTKSLVRSDFSKEIGKFIMYQSSLVMLNKGYAVSFSFIGSNEDEIDQLINRLGFVAVANKR